eukprot:g8975.t1
MARGTIIGDDIDGGLLLDRTGPSVGIAISTDDLEATMESAAELGGRLAAALAGTVRSKRREPASASVPDLLTKVRGIFGNRLACVGREIRVSRNVEAERNETLLLRQVHALKNAALDACNGEKWCLVVSSDGESLVVCSVPLPSAEEGGAYGCDFLVFDPAPRPAMKLYGSSIVKFTTVRKEKWRRWSEEDYGLPGKIMANGEVIAVSSPKGREDPPPAGGQEGTARVEAVEHVSGRTDPDEALNSDNPLHRALLRSIEGEELAEYSKRAYSIYRAHGVIQDGAKLDDYPESETTANGFPMPAKQQRFLPATSPPASPASIVHDASRSETIPTVDEDHHGGARKECDHGLHRRRNGEHGDGNEVCTGGEGVGGPGKAPDDEEFVWFGQPDTPSGCQPEQAVKAWGFRPALPENPAKTVQSERLAPDATPPEVVVAVGEVHPVESLVPVPPPEFAHRVAATADNPWRRVVSRQELASPPPAKQEPTPPPIRFNVESNAFGDDLERPGGRMNLEQEKARRQERYEGLRARKMAEAEERRRGQKQRQAATREEQRRKTAAAAAAAAVTDKAQHGQDTIQDPMRQNIVQHGVPFADGPSSVRDHRDTPPTSSSAVRPRSSSLATNDDGCTRQGTGVGSLGGSNGSGKGRPRLSAPGACSVASPPVRGFSRRSNRKLVRNAISFLCLAGGHLEKKKARVLEALDSHPASNFVVLLAHTKLLSFKGLYACSGEEDGTADRVFGLGPPHVDATMVSGFYKYNSAAREFREVHSKSLGKTTDAVSMEPTRLKRPKIMVNQ